jgi:leucyl aminopeptidase
MAITVRVASARPETDALALAVFQDDLDALAREWPGLGEAVRQGYRAGLGDVVVLYPNQPRRLVIAGLGPKSTADARSVRRGLAEGVHRALARGIATVAAEVSSPTDYQDAAVLGAAEGAYRFRRYRTADEDEPVDAVITVVATRTAPLTLALAEAAWSARDWVNLGSNDKPPAVLADLMRERLGSRVETRVIDHEELRRMGAGGILAVGQGSVHPPVMLVARYRGRPDDDRTLALVGKGITFDSGGLSLKTGQGMMRMKGDMAGAAAVMAAVAALAETGAPVNVMGIACLAENMPDGGAQRPGDVIRTLDGKTVEVLNTDAEGRLVLADGVAYARREGANAIVDIATLTGANAQALGGVRAGYLTRVPALATLLEEAARETGEAVWPMPPDDHFRQALKSPIADLKNIGTQGGGGMQVGGLFIGAFAGDTPWLHVDIAGVAFQEDARDGRMAGATGYGVALLGYLATRWFASPAV